MIRPVLIALALAAPGSSVVASDVIQGRATVIDGDTLEIRGSRIRLAAIDAPESRQQCKDAAGRNYPCGRQAALFLDAFLSPGKTVRCEVSAKDRYNRLIADCFVGSTSINALMVVSGWALPYRRYGGSKYDQHEAVAKAARRGVWQGQFESPEQFRRGN